MGTDSVPAVDCSGHAMTGNESRSKSWKSQPPAVAWRTAIAGLLAMAAAFGIGRFVYTPILPAMLDALGWNKADAGLVASANFLGYLAGAAVAGWPVFAGAARAWIVAALAVSAATTAGMGMLPDFSAIMALRFTGGVASAFVIVCASTVVLDHLSATGRANLAAVHFAGVGAGILVSAAAVAAAAANGMGWRSLWLVSGATAALAGLFAAVLLRPAADNGSHRPFAAASPVPASPVAINAPVPARMIAAYGLFGFGYVITATFLVTIVRQSTGIAPLEPWIWMLFGLAAVPSVPLWQWLGHRIGLMQAFAAASVVEAVGVAASVEWVTVPGVCTAAVLLGGTFMGLTALGLVSARALAGSRAQRVISLMTVSFSAGQMAGPAVAGMLSERTGSLRAASLLAAAALMVAALLAMGSAASSRSPDRARRNPG
jgi:predicted MFS family arabinose efflux permease